MTRVNIFQRFVVSHSFTSLKSRPHSCGYHTACNTFIHSSIDLFCSFLPSFLPSFLRPSFLPSFSLLFIHSFIHSFIQRVICVHFQDYLREHQYSTVNRQDLYSALQQVHLRIGHKKQTAHTHTHTLTLTHTRDHSQRACFIFHPRVRLTVSNGGPRPQQRSCTTCPWGWGSQGAKSRDFTADQPPFPLSDANAAKVPVVSNFYCVNRA